MLTVFLALGAWRISQKNVLTRRIPAVESLGSATVLCVDKTGTLTLNRMTIARLFAGGRFFAVPREEAGIRPARRQRRRPLGRPGSRGLSRTGGIRDPRERARSVRSDGEGLQGARGTVLRRLRAPARRLGAGPRVPAVAGAAGHVSRVALARRAMPMSSPRRAHLRPSPTSATWMRPQHRGTVPSHRDHGRRRPQGPRCGQGSSSEGTSGRGRSTISTSPSWDWWGSPTLRARRWPSRSRSAGRAGIRVIMITGDYPGTARAIARQIGLEPAEHGDHRPRAGGHERSQNSRSASGSATSSPGWCPSRSSSWCKRSRPGVSWWP